MKLLAWIILPLVWLFGAKLKKKNIKTGETSVYRWFKRIK